MLKIVHVDVERRRICSIFIYLLFFLSFDKIFRSEIRFPRHRLHADILGSDRCGRTNTNANANGKWRVTRHRHLRLINATPAATIQQGGAAHENAAGDDHYAGQRRRRQRSCQSERRCPNQSRVFNYARHRPVLLRFPESTRMIKKKIRLRNRFSFSS